MCGECGAVHDRDVNATERYMVSYAGSEVSQESLLQGEDINSVRSSHVREVVTAGNFSAFWMGVVIVGLMSGAYMGVMARPAANHQPVASQGPCHGRRVLGRPGRVRFLGIRSGHRSGRRWAGDRQCPIGFRTVTISEQLPRVAAEVSATLALSRTLKSPRNCWKRTAALATPSSRKPVLIGTALWSAQRPCMVFSIRDAAATGGLTENARQTSLLHHAVSARPDFRW